jgi:hypothetical protein
LARSFSIRNKGLKELQKSMRAMETAIEPGEVSPILVEALNIMRVKAIANLAAQGVKTKTGTLINHLITKATASTKYAGAWLKADAVKEYGAANAKHAHLIERGHVQWSAFVKGNGTIAGRIRGNRKAGIGHQLGEVKARPFFRPALDSTRRQMQSWIRKGLQQLLKSAAMRAGFSDDGQNMPDDQGWIG